MHLNHLKALIVLSFVYLLAACAPGGGGSSASEDLSDGSGQGNNPYVPSACSLMSSLTCEVFGLVNEARAQQGLSPLRELGKCIQEAQSHSDDMALNNYFSHDGLSETTAQRFARFGLSGAAWAENIASGYTTAAAVMNGWLNSSGHRANILGANYKSMGVGYTKSAQGKTYWVQCFSSLTP